MIIKVEKVFEGSNGSESRNDIWCINDSDDRNDSWNTSDLVNRNDKQKCTYVPNDLENRIIFEAQIIQKAEMYFR